MKLPFFMERKAVTYFSETARINLQEQITLKFEKLLPLPYGLLRIHFNFIAANEADTEKLVCKLKDMDNEILYSRGRQILGRSAYLKNDEQQLKQNILAIAEAGLNINCLVDDWRIEGDFNNRLYGGLVVKQWG